MPILMRRELLKASGDKNEIYDLAIAGAGPAGLAAVVYFDNKTGKSARKGVNGIFILIGSDPHT